MLTNELFKIFLVDNQYQFRIIVSQFSMTECYFCIMAVFFFHYEYFHIIIKNSMQLFPFAPWFLNRALLWLILSWRFWVVLVLQWYTWVTLWWTGWFFIYEPFTFTSAIFFLKQGWNFIASALHRLEYGNLEEDTDCKGSSTSREEECQRIRASCIIQQSYSKRNQIYIMDFSLVLPKRNSIYSTKLCTNWSVSIFKK